MMVDLFKAEWQKLVGNRRPFAFLVLIYPIGAFTIVMLIALTLLFSDSERARVAANPPLWTETMVNVWGLFARFPGNLFATMPFLSFTAVMFAGEYQWGTWKNLVPRHDRWALILMKFLTTGVVVVLSLLATSLIWGGGGWLQTLLVAVPYGPAMTETTLVDFLRDFGLQAATTFTGSLIMIGFVALFAMYSRSILASLLLTLGVRIAESTAVIFLLLAEQAFDIEGLVNWFSITPVYNLDNIVSWVLNDVGSTVGGMPGFTNVLSLPQSVMVLLVWMVGLVGGTAVLFQRQDIL